MKLPKYIVRGLASGALRLRPEVMDVIRNLVGDSKQTAEAQAPKPVPPDKEPPAAQSPCGTNTRLVLVSPMPGRWIRWSCTMLACSALICLVQPAIAGEARTAFDSANQASVEGKPAEAARILEGVIAREGYSAPVLFNLANAELREGKIGRAFLNYERARWLAASDRDIATNLRLVQERTQVATVGAWPLRFADWFTLNTWAGLGAAALLLVAATLPLDLLLERPRPALRLARILTLMMMFSSIAAIGVRWGELNRAVVTAKAADARISPVTVGAPMFTLPEGTVVSIVKSHGRFALVNTRNGQQGWVNRDAVEPVVARGKD